MDAKTKVRESRLRRIASRQGLRLEKSRQRDPMAPDYGKYSLVNGRSNHIYTFSLDRRISIKLRSGLRVGIVSIFGEDLEQLHYLSPVTLASRHTLFSRHEQLNENDRLLGYTSVN